MSAKIPAKTAQKKKTPNKMRIYRPNRRTERWQIHLDEPTGWQ